MIHSPPCRLCSFLRHAFAGAGIAFSLTVPAGAQEDLSRCDRRVAGVGFPRPSQQLAELSAIGKWLEAAGQLSDDMPAWHRAKGKSMKCEEIGTIGRISCTVIARPCYEAAKDETASTNDAVR